MGTVNHTYPYNYAPLILSVLLNFGKTLLNKSNKKIGTFCRNR